MRFVKLEGDAVFCYADQSTFRDGERFVELTDACLSRMSSPLALPAHGECYESFGEARGGVHDLGPVLDAMRVARREFITSEDAEAETAHCNHGPGIFLREYLDWRPFAYFTCRTTLPPRRAKIVGNQHHLETCEFVPISEHTTRIVFRVRVLDRPQRTTLRLRAARDTVEFVFTTIDQLVILIRGGRQRYATPPLPTLPPPRLGRRHASPAP